MLTKSLDKYFGLSNLKPRHSEPMPKLFVATCNVPIFLKCMGIDLPHFGPTRVYMVERVQNALDNYNIKDKAGNKFVFGTRAFEIIQ